MQLGKPSKTVPANVTIKWGVPEGYQGSIGVTRALMSGAAVAGAETRTAGQPYCEHYLCPDSPSSMLLRGLAFKTGAQTNPGKRTADVLVVQPKHNYVVKLSEIIQYLQGRAHGQPIEVVWTVCRSPIGKQALGIAKWVKGAITFEAGLRGDPNQKQNAGEMYMNQAGRNEVGADVLGVINAVDGCITAVDGTQYATMDQATTWPGIEGTKLEQSLAGADMVTKSATKPVTRGRSSSNV
jgi:hypothetical protein